MSTAGPRTHRETVAAPLPGLPEEVPEFLTGLPWDRPVKPVVTGLKPPAERRFSWKGGGWDRRLRSEKMRYPEPADADWADLLGRYHGRAPRHLKMRFLLNAPDDMVRPLFANWKGGVAPECEPWPLTPVARFGLDAFPFAWEQAVHIAPGKDGLLLVPFLDADVAAVMCDRLHRHPGGRGLWTLTWLDWHGLDAVPYLVPAALGRKAGPRRGAEAALRHLAAGHGVDAVAGAVPAAADELRAVLSAHPFQTGLARRSKLPRWADPAALPRPLLRGREAALPPDAVRSLVELLAASDPYAVGEMREACDPGSLAEFGRALFERWRTAGEPAEKAWALVQLGRTGDDASVRRLLPLIGTWSWERGNGYRTALKGLGVLAELGTDQALFALHDIAETMRFESVAGGAAARFREAAAARGLTPEQLADRVVPDLGLDAECGTTLDYGRRRFRVNFDEQFHPRFADEDGKPRKALPKPADRDDPDLAPAAYGAFTELRKQVPQVVAERLRSMEGAMVDGRRWTPGEFRERILAHPIAGRLARSLVWLADTAAFRVAEDGTFADVHDDPFVPPEHSRVGVAHPVHLWDDLAAWRAVFGDYELLQAFPQLERPAVRLTGRERDADRLDRFAGLRLSEADVRPVISHDSWRLAHTSREPGEVRFLWWPIDAGRRIAVGFGRGPWPEGTGETMTVEYVRATVRPAKTGDPAGEPVRFGDLDAVAVSEALAALTMTSP